MTKACQSQTASYTTMTILPDLGPELISRCQILFSASLETTVLMGTNTTVIQHMEPNQQNLVSFKGLQL